MKMRVSIAVNGSDTSAEVEPRLLLVHYLRDVLGLTGTNVGCDTSQCGSCTVLVDGEAVKSCTVLAVQADDKPESWTRQPGWPELVRSMARHIENRGRPVAVAAFRLD